MEIPHSNCSLVRFSAIRRHAGRGFTWHIQAALGNGAGHA
jgi:hypothetical protein